MNIWELLAARYGVLSHRERELIALTIEATRLVVREANDGDAAAVLIQDAGRVPQHGDWKSRVIVEDGLIDGEEGA